MDEPKQEIGITSKSMQKVATVTGAARGIGLGTVKRFLVDGWRVALLDIDEETLNRSAADLHTDSVLPICCDVADAAGVTKAFSAVAQTFGRLDVLVNNAGIAIFKPILNITYEEWSRVLAVNQRCALQVASYGNMTTSRAVRSLLHQNSSRK